MAALLRGVSSPAASGVATCSTLMPPRCSVTGRSTLRLTGTSKCSGSAPSSAIESGAKLPGPGAAPRSSTRSRRLTASSTMAKAGAVSTTTRRSQSSALPVSSTCTGAGKLGQRLRVVHLAVGDQDRAGDAVGGQLGRRLGERGQQLRALLAAVGDADGAHLEPAGLRRAARAAPRAPPSASATWRVAPVDAVAGAVVGHHQRDVGDRRAVLLAQRRPGERREQHQRRQRAQPPAAQPAPGGERHRRGAPAPPGRRSAPAAAAGRSAIACSYCPSRSSSAGTCTWSDL